MTTTTEKADDDLDVFDALESEEKEFIKVSDVFPLLYVAAPNVNDTRMPKSLVF